MNNQNTLDRLEVGIDRISRAVEKFNEVAIPSGLPPISLRCASAMNQLHGEHDFLRRLYRMQTENMLLQIEAIERAKRKTK